MLDPHPGNICPLPKKWTHGDPPLDTFSDYAPDLRSQVVPTTAIKFFKDKKCPIKFWNF